ncbi:hypothetical protein BG015_002137 [Linnemannia schmuckeri]|uniref:Uncharacterized protein n=1 Tax=Linnemannia schmuckeri TaxID=64567 RepID=A0A9P5VDR5_9FUNG|nr:hypothetical protein BG015_002137 [Linnemannia schmuckeri]
MARVVLLISLGVPFATQQWMVPTAAGKTPRTIAKGFYKKQVAFMINPAWPSSLYGSTAWIHYDFRIQISKCPASAVSQPYCCMAFEKSVWILNAPLPKLLVELSAGPLAPESQVPVTVRVDNYNKLVLVDVHIVTGQASTAEHISSVPPEYEQAEEHDAHAFHYTLATTAADELPSYARTKA